MQTQTRAVRKRHASPASSEVTRLRKELSEERAARKAAESRCAELEAQVEFLTDRVRSLTEQVERLLKNQNQTQEMLQKRIRKLEKDVADRDKKLEKQEKTLKWFRKKVFGSTTEKDVESDESKGKERKQKAGGRGQQTGSKGHGRTNRDGIPLGDRYPITQDCKCDECGVTYKRLETVEESTLFEFAEGLYQDIYERSKYVSQCQCHGKKIVTAPAPPKLYPRTSIGNSLWVRLVVQKFLQGVPTNRTLKELSLMGFPLSQGTVTGGFKTIRDLLEPLYEGITKRCQAADLWNADETTWRVFGGSGKKWWLWLIASNDAAVYILDESRSSTVPNNFFVGCAGTLMTDRFSSYKGLSDEVRKAWCWVHVRRDFREIMGMPALKKWATKWLKQIAKLFVLSHERYKLWESCKKANSDSLIAATEKIKKHLTGMRRQWERELKESGLHAERQKVLNSLRRHWNGLTLFVEDPRIPLHNNRAERLLRGAVILRKNSYGSGAAWSGELAARLFSIMQTWLMNGLDPRRMLQDYFDECSKTPGRAPPDVSEFLPWSMSAEHKAAAALPASYSRPG